MSTRRQAASATRHALWLGGLGIVLAGLFGMHGLDTHGMTSSNTAHVGMASSAMSPSDGHGATLDGAHLVGPMVAAVSEVTVSPGQPVMHMGMAGMCMAVLAIALLALMQRLSSRRGGRVLWVSARPVRASRRAGRDPDPPSLIDLSIRRC